MDKNGYKGVFKDMGIYSLFKELKNRHEHNNSKKIIIWLTKSANNKEENIYDDKRRICKKVSWNIWKIKT